MLLSSLADHNYDDQTSSSNPSGLPSSGDVGSSRGDRYRNMLSEAFGFGGGRSSGNGDRGSSRNDNERRNSRPPATSWRNERSHLDTKPPNYHLSRDDLRDLALGTLQILDEGEYFPPGAVEPYELKMKIKWTDENTRYYGPDAGVEGEILESEFVRINEEVIDEGNNDKEEERVGDVEIGVGEENKNASSLDETERGSTSEKPVSTTLETEKKQIDDNSNPKAQEQAQASLPPDPKVSATPDTPIYIGEYSTLVGARKVHLGLASNLDSSNKKIGVLNFASAKKPGGGFINGSQAQEESIARASTLYPSLITTAASQFYTHYHEDPSNAYYTHAMVYSPSIILLRDDNGEWRSPVEVDVLTSAAVNAGEIRRRIEREERLRRERVEMEIWKKKGEQRRREMEAAMAERERQRKEKQKAKKEKEQVGKLGKKAESTKLEGKVQSGDGNEAKETNKGKKKDSGSEKEEPSVKTEKVDAEGEKEKEQEPEAEKSEENQEEKATDNPESGSSSDGEMKKTEENVESKGASIQDDQHGPEAPVEVNQDPTSSTTISHPLSSQTQPSQTPDPDPDLIYAHALSTAEYQIQYTMYTRISRILHLFQLHQTPHLILGSFGTGVFQNRIDLVANIFANLLVKPGGRFKNVFKTVVFAILGKETVRIFWDVFSRVEKRAQREGGVTGGASCVFVDSDGRDGDVREGEEERMMRMMKWEARRTALADAAQAEIDATSFAAAQTDAAAYAAAQPEIDDVSFAAAQAAFAAHAGATSAVPTDPIPAGDDEIPEDEKMILTGDDEKVDLAVEDTTNATTTPKAIITDEGKDIEMVEIKSLSASYREAQNPKSYEKEDDDVEMQ